MSKMNLRKEIRRIVESFIAEKKNKKLSTPILQRGFFPYFSYEPQEVDNSFDVGGEMVEENKETDIETLNFFDFDGTLIDTQEEEEGKKKYKEITGNDYPHDDWWGNPESLTTFENKPIDKVVYEYKNKKDVPGSLNFVLTNRESVVEPQVKDILDANNLFFDGYSFRDGNIEKPDRIKAFLKQYPGVKNINVYDDREDQISLFKTLKNELKQQGIILNIFKVSKK